MAIRNIVLFLFGQASEDKGVNLSTLIIILAFIWIAICLITWFITRIYFPRWQRRHPEGDVVAKAKVIRWLRYIIYAATFVIIAIYFALKVLAPGALPF